MSILRWSVAWVLILTLTWWPARGKGQPLPADTTAVTIHTGVTHRTIIRAEGPWVIHVVELDLSCEDLDVAAVRAGDTFYGRERVSSMAQRTSASGETVLAGINADFFDLRTGEVENNMVANGEFVKGVRVTASPHDVFDNPHSQFAVSSRRRPSIDRYEFSGWVQPLHASRVLALASVNVPPRRGEVALFNYWFDSTAAFDSSGDLLSCAELERIGRCSDSLICVVRGFHFRNSTKDLKRNALLLSTQRADSSLLPAFLGMHDTVLVFLGTRPYVHGLTTLVGGWPRLVHNGVNIAHRSDSLEGTFPRFSAHRHPRSGIGISADGSRVFLVTVDGRQERSVGMTLVEFGDFMVSLGIHDGLNFDGGGSTVMVVRGEVVNRPSDLTGERAVGNALLILSRQSTENHSTREKGSSPP